LFYKYIGLNNTPYEKVKYVIENDFGYFWEELDHAKRIKK